MEDTSFTASIGDTPNSPDVDTSATSASSEAGVTSPHVEANATTPADSQIDVGWSLEDEQPQFTIPDNDEDLEPLKAEPGLDPARTPGLVEAVRKARQAARDSGKEAGSLKQQLASLEQYGGAEVALSTLGLVNGLITNPTEGGVEFLSTLRSQATPAYHELADLIAFNDAEYLVAKLQEYGKLPAQQSYSPIDAEAMAEIPEHLQGVAKNLPPNVLAELMLEPPDTRNFHLEREQKLQQLGDSQRQQAEKEWQSQVSAAQATGQTAISTLSDQYEQGHYSRLSKWQPFGPEGKESNQLIHGMVVEGAYARLLSDPKFAQMRQDAAEMLGNAPMRKLRGESLAASQDETRARGLAAQFNARLGQLIKEQVTLLDSTFRDAQAYRTSQRKDAPERREIAGNTVVGNGNGVRALDENGRVTKEYKERLAASLPDF